MQCVAINQSLLNLSLFIYNTIWRSWGWHSTIITQFFILSFNFFFNFIIIMLSNIKKKMTIRVRTIKNYQCNLGSGCLFLLDHYLFFFLSFIVWSKARIFAVFCIKREPNVVQPVLGWRETIYINSMYSGERVVKGWRICGWWLEHENSKSKAFWGECCDVMKMFVELL